MARINRQLKEECGYRSVQQAVLESGNNDRVVIMPGVYTERRSRRQHQEQLGPVRDLAAVQQQPPYLLAERRAARLPHGDLRQPLLREPGGEQPHLRRLARPLDALEHDEQPALRHAA